MEVFSLLESKLCFVGYYLVFFYPPHSYIAVKMACGHETSCLHALDALTVHFGSMYVLCEIFVVGVCLMLILQT